MFAKRIGKILTHFLRKRVVLFYCVSSAFLERFICAFIFSPFRLNLILIFAERLIFPDVDVAEQRSTHGRQGGRATTDAGGLAAQRGLAGHLHGKHQSFDDETISV